MALISVRKTKAGLTIERFGKTIADINDKNSILIYASVLTLAELNEIHTVANNFDLFSENVIEE